MEIADKKPKAKGVSMEERIQTYEEFWPFYLKAHSHPVNRAFHIFGTLFALILVASFPISGNPWVFLMAPIIGYAFAWFGHFRVENNVPATFKYPFWSFISDLRMSFCFLVGRLDSELRRAKVAL